MFHPRPNSKNETSYRYISLLKSQLPDPTVLQPPDELHLARCQEEQRGTSCTHPGCTTDSMDVISGSGRCRVLHYPVHMWQVQAPRRHVLQRECHFERRYSQLPLWQQPGHLLRASAHILTVQL